MSGGDAQYGCEDMEYASVEVRADDGGEDGGSRNEGGKGSAKEGCCVFREYVAGCGLVSVAVTETS